MTVTIAAAPSEIAVAPATGFRRRAVAVAGILGGVLTAAGFAATVWETGPGTAAYLDSLVVDPVRSQVAALLLQYGYLGMVPVVLALGVMTRRRARVAGNVGLALALPAALALPGLLVTDFYDISLRQALPPEQAVAVSEGAQALPLAGLLVAGPWILLSFVGMTVLGVAAWRAGFFGRLPTLLIPVSVVSSMVLPFGMIANLVSGAALGAFMIAVGVVALRMTDQEWVSGTRGAGR